MHAQKLVLVESPFKGRGATPSARARDALLNFRYARALCRTVALAGIGQNPFASHLFCTQFLYDSDPTERKLGIEIGLAWGRHAQTTIVGIDRGISDGVAAAVVDARRHSRAVVWLSLEAYKDSWLPSGVDRKEWEALVSEGEKVSVHKGDI